MLFDTFALQVRDFWTRYCRELRTRFRIDENGKTLLYPTTVLVMECGAHFGYELVGASTSPVKLAIRKRKISSATQFFNVFSDNDNEGKPIFTVNGRRNSFQGLMLAHESAKGVTEDRFPITDTFDTKIYCKDGRGALVRVGPEANQFFLSDCVLAEGSEVFARCRYVQHCGFLVRNTTAQELENFLQWVCFQPFDDGFHLQGALAIPDVDHDILIMSHLQSLFLSKGIHETTIGDFLNQHRDVVNRAFGCTDFIYEPYLRWLEHDGSVIDTAINPDLLIRRPDGAYDIVDLKLAGLSHRRITKGRRNRRRFIDYVNEGVAQLTNYKFYFDFPLNAKYALETYGVSINRPNLILVVGHSENADQQEVKEAMKMFGGSRLQVVDYDALARAYFHRKSMMQN